MSSIVQFHIDSQIQMEQIFFSQQILMVCSAEDFGVCPIQEIFWQILMVCSVEDFGGQSNEQFSPVEDPVEELVSWMAILGSVPQQWLLKSIFYKLHATF